MNERGPSAATTTEAVIGRYVVEQARTVRDGPLGEVTIVEVIYDPVGGFALSDEVAKEMLKDPALRSRVAELRPDLIEGA